MSKRKSLHKELGPAAIPALSGMIAAEAEEQELPDYFTVEHEDGPGVTITNTKNGKSYSVPLFAYGEVREALNNLL